jgi:DNA polymerase-3 subunit chi
VTEVAFHFNVPDRTAYTCRLVRKAHRTGATVVLAGPAPALAHLDRALWTFEDLEFLPHVLLRPGQAVEPRWQTTRVWLSEDASQPGHHDVLVNLGDDPPAGFESFGKLIEIVSADEAERTAARARWRHYSSRGYAIRKHEVAA